MENSKRALQRSKEQLQKPKSKSVRKSVKKAKKELEEVNNMNEGDSTVKRERAEKCVNFNDCTFFVTKGFKV